jgi:hypothetical protein
MKRLETAAPFSDGTLRMVAASPTSDERWMKIATFNINNINRRLPNLLDWLKAAKPDVVCLQELKCSERDFPAAPIKDVGYSAVWRGEKTWNGVAILARREPVLTSTTLPGDPADKQARYIEAAVEGILICCLYLPNGNPQPGLQTRLVSAAGKACRRIARGENTGGPLRRLQRRADAHRHLSDDVVGQRRSDSPQKPGRVCPTGRSGVDRRPSHDASQ